MNVVICGDKVVIFQKYIIITSRKLILLRNVFLLFFIIKGALIFFFYYYFLNRIDKKFLEFIFFIIRMFLKNMHKIKCNILCARS